MFNIKGLTDVEVSNSRKEYGDNSITHYKKNTFLNLVIESLNDPIIKILLIALGVKILFLFNDSDVYETMGIIFAIILASVISSLSEYGSEKAFLKLSMEASSLNAKVYRNSHLVSLPIEDVVVGDYVLVESGDKICADGYLYSGSIYTDESMLSGESDEKFKDKSSEVFRGSVVTQGSGVMVVKTVGDNTFYGHIAKDIQEAVPESPLKNRLKDLASFISKIGYIATVLVIVSYLFNVLFISNNFDMSKVLGMLRDKSVMVPHLLYALTLGVTIIVVAVPEGLPMMITLVLSSNMKRLVKNNVLVRKLVGIESSGSLNILFSDKTGTITKGKLSVSEIVSYNGVSYKSLDSMSGKFYELVNISLVYNNEAELSNGEVLGGNVTDRAIIKFVKDASKGKYRVIRKQGFDSRFKFSSVRLNYEGGLSFFKGAFEKIISGSSSYYLEDGSVSYNFNSSEIVKRAEKYTGMGYRVLGLATSLSEELKDACFLGLVLIKDEIRKEAIKGIELVKNAGIQTVMITGDNLLTATVIAREAGLISNEKDIVISSQELNSMSDIEVKEILPRLRVVARSLPEDKKRLVLLSQELGLVVGMTGDGVNDAPALRKADVGFAMGSGTEVTKEVSDIIILDDNFLSIAKTILFGRTIFKSIRKFIIFQLTVNITAVSLSIIGPFFGIIAPVPVIQMLWINMVMDTLAGVAYSFEPPLLEYMSEEPKKRNEKIMNSYMKNEILVTGIYMSLVCMFFLKSDFIRGFYRIGEEDKYLMTAFFGLFIFITIFNSFNARTYRLNVFANLFKNKVFLVIILFVMVVQVLLIYFGGSIFRTTGLSFLEFDVMLVVAFSVIPFDILRKIVLKKMGKKIGV